ncbi:hypothetical protein [Marinospirillum alkaliphilum]|uniref:Uncharacterized protein n=1 Tax=Marinospirillum alkaliphilum DSM 21637 TaxID=1122209 RepID=A0A1K1YX67_9GAMM|nr:hypothetical protein [Marinospirillum alkaliphilum]SFX66464.1 hypothetical protein SAMN02745752_02444 [Marinospirillum alkaliphilum DSM 21637]
MITNYYELDGDGFWLPENWRRMDLYTKKNGKFVPRNGIYGCKWAGSLGDIEIIKNHRMHPSLSKDRMAICIFEVCENYNKKLFICHENGSVLARLDVPVFDGQMNCVPTFYSIIMPGLGKDAEIKYNNGDDDYMARLTPDFKIVDEKKIRW